MATLSVPTEPLEASTSSLAHNSSLSSTNGTSSRLDAGEEGRGDRKKIRGKKGHRILAACTGAIVTSLTSKSIQAIGTLSRTPEVKGNRVIREVRNTAVQIAGPHRRFLAENKADYLFS